MFNLLLMKDLLLNYTRYNLRANKLLCDVMAALTDEQIDMEIVSSFPSIRKTVYHMWGAEDIWKRRLSRESTDTWAPKHFKGAFTEALQSWQDTSQWYIDFIQAAGDELLLGNLTYKNMAGDEYTNSVRDIVQHVMNHSTYHRGQLVTMLRQAGVTEIPSTDYIAFLR